MPHPHTPPGKRGWGLGTRLLLMVQYSWHIVPCLCNPHSAIAPPSINFSIVSNCVLLMEIWLPFVHCDSISNVPFIATPTPQLPVAPYATCVSLAPECISALWLKIIMFKAKDIQFHWHCSFLQLLWKKVCMCIMYADTHVSKTITIDKMKMYFK